MPKITPYTDEITKYLSDLSEDNNWDIIITNEYNIEFIHKDCSIVIMSYRYEEGTTFLIKDLRNKKKYAIWKIYKDLKKTGLNYFLDERTKDATLQSIYWNLSFISRFLGKVFLGDFSEVEDINSSFPPKEV